MKNKMTEKRGKTINFSSLDNIYNGDVAELLTSLQGDSVDLIVSSPPYNIGKEYESRKALDHYLEDQTTILKECVRCLKSTGSLFWQVGSYSEKGVLIPLDIRFFPILESLGMYPRNRIIWVLTGGLGPIRCGYLYSH